jgi:hypothetical protein
VNSARDDLIRYLKLSAQSRAQKAQEHPDDERYARGSEAMAQAARDLAAVPPWDPRLLRIESLFAVGDEESVAAYHLESTAILSAFGMDSADDTVEQLLDRLSAVADRV